MAKTTNGVIATSEPEYKIPAHLLGKECFTRVPPTSVRKEGGGKFILNDNLTKAERQWLAEVIGIELEKISE